MYIRKNTRPM